MNCLFFSKSTTCEKALCSDNPFWALRLFFTDALSTPLPQNALYTYAAFFELCFLCATRELFPIRGKKNRFSELQSSVIRSMTNFTPQRATGMVIDFGFLWKNFCVSSLRHRAESCFKRKFCIPNHFWKIWQPFCVWHARIRVNLYFFETCFPSNSYASTCDPWRFCLPFLFLLHAGNTSYHDLWRKWRCFCIVEPLFFASKEELSLLCFDFFALEKAFLCSIGNQLFSKCFLEDAFCSCSLLFNAYK